MGAELSIINDTPSRSRIEVWTWGHGFLVTSGSIASGDTLSLPGLGRVRYDVKAFQWRLGAQTVETTAVQLGGTVTKMRLSEVFGPEVFGPEVGGGVVEYTPAGSEEDLSVKAG